MRLLLAQFSSSGKFLWIQVLLVIVQVSPPNLVSLINLQVVHPGSSPGSSIKTLNNMSKSSAFWVLWSLQPPSRFQASHCHFLSPEIQAILSPSNHHFFQSMLPQLPNENAVGYGVKRFPKAEVYHIFRPPLVHKDSHFVVGGSQIS